MPPIVGQSVSQEEITTNANNISTNASNIATNVTDIATNASNIASGNSDITLNLQNITKMITRIYTLENALNTAIARINSLTGDLPEDLVITSPDVGPLTLGISSPETELD